MKAIMWNNENLMSCPVLEFLVKNNFIKHLGIVDNIGYPVFEAKKEDKENIESLLKTTKYRVGVIWN